MRQRELVGCQNPWKHHLWRLPSIPKEKAPENYLGKSQECLAVFPLFQTNEGDESLEHHLVRSGCWARRSWLLFSDAIRRDVKIGFYVEESVLERVLPLLEENHIDIDNDVFLMDGDPFQGDPCTHLGKKMALFNDKQFSNYKWVVQLDCDMYLGSRERKQINFFEYLSDHRQDSVGAVIAHLESHGDPPHANAANLHWHHCLLNSDNMEEKLEEWFRRAEGLVGADAIQSYRDENQFSITCHGGLYAWPMRRFTKERPDACEWVANAGRILQDDEAVFSLWACKGENLFSVTHETGVPFCTEIGLVNEVRHQCEVYFSHIATIVHEWHWREDIDAL